MLIFLIGAILRFYQLGAIPDGFFRDEAFLSYNAYSILKTGMDMSGNFLPLHLESFLYSPAGYSYFSIPFIFLFGLNEFSSRFASAFFGSLTVIISYFLVLELFYKAKEKEVLALLTALFVAVSPWNIILSRTATENVVVVFFIALGTYLFLISLRKNKIIFLCLGFISFLITMFTYQAPRSFLPLFIPLLLIIFLYKRFNSIYFKLSSILYLVFIILPVLYVIFSPTLSTRIKTLSVFNYPETKAELGQSYRAEGVSHVPLLISRVFHNKVTGYSSEIIKNYFNHFSYDFLFTDSYLPDRYQIPNHGLLYLFDIPLLLVGVWEIIGKKKKEGLFLIGWVLLSPIGSSLTFDDVPNMQRTLIMFPALSIISAIGFLAIYNFVKRKKLLVGISVIILVFSVSYFSLQYFVDSQYFRPWYRQGGYRQLVSEVNILLPKYKYAVITNRETAPTIFFLFYDKYDPKLFQEETKNLNKVQTDSMDFGKYVFSSEQCPLRVELGSNGKPKLVGEEGLLYVDSGLCQPQKGLNYISTIYRKDGSTVFRLVDYRGGNIAQNE